MFLFFFSLLGDLFSLCIIVILLLVLLCYVTIQGKGNALHLLLVLGLDVVIIWSTPRRSPRVAMSQRRSKEDDELPQISMPSSSAVVAVGSVVLQRKSCWYSRCIMALGEVNGV